MVRIVILLIIAIATWLLLLKLFRAVKGARIDWTGIATIIGFIVLAFYLRHVTGMG